MRLLPRDEKFFDLFTAVATFTVEAARLQQDLLRADHQRRGVIVDQFKRLEHQADQVTHDVVSRLDRVFITPLDREDIHQLACRLDDILDLVDAAISRIYLYKVGDLTEDARAMCRNLAQATRVLVQGVAKLRRPRDHADILPCCIEIHTCENEGDRLEQHALAALFEHTRDAAEIIKWKDIYEDLEDAIDRCEDAANVLESLVLKSS